MPVEHSGAAAFDAQRDELVRVLATSLPQRERDTRQRSPR
jgi:hypothetical protein